MVLPTSSNPRINTLPAPAPSFADVLACWPGHEQGNKEESSHVRLPIAKASPGSPLILQYMFIGESFFESDSPEISLYCVNEKGCSVQVRIKDLYHYFFYPAPTLIKFADMIPLRDHLNDLLNSSPRLVDSPVHDIKIVKRKIDTDDTEAVRLLQIFVHPNEMKNVQDKSSFHFESFAIAGIYLTPKIHVFTSGSLKYKNLFTVPEASFDARLLYIWRFLFDHKIEPMEWIKIPANEYKLVPVKDRISRTQLEVSIEYVGPAFHPGLLETEFCGSSANVLSKTAGPQFAPFRILSFDIETNVPADGSFPTADKDHVIQIGCMVSVPEKPIPQIRKIFTLHDCLPITGAEVHSFSTEAEMLLAWRQFFLEVDPDIVTGYNILCFDIPFLVKRAISCGLSHFSDLGRIIGLRQNLPDGPNDYYNCPEFAGRLLLDVMYQLVVMTGKRYKLDNIAFTELGEKKEQMHFTDIPKLQGSGPPGRYKLAVYCLKDVYLPLRLISKLQIFEEHIARAKAAEIPMNMMRSPPDDLKRLSNFVKEAAEAVENDCVIPAKVWGYWDKQ